MSPLSPTQPQIRKRRRRAPATGASEDCHACRKRGSTCDRRRPYCSQCLEIGKECSGYRTTLTWGVGVASRGKLRGKTLPVLNVVTPPMNQTHAKITTPPRPSAAMPSRDFKAVPQLQNTSAEGSRKRLKSDVHVAPKYLDHMQPLLPTPPPSGVEEFHGRPDGRNWYHNSQQLRRQTHDAIPSQRTVNFDHRHGSLQHHSVGQSHHVFIPPSPFGDHHVERQQQQQQQHIPHTPDGAPSFIDPFLSTYNDDSSYRFDEASAYSASVSGPTPIHEVDGMRWSSRHDQEHSWSATSPHIKVEDDEPTTRSVNPSHISIRLDNHDEASGSEPGSEAEDASRRFGPIESSSSAMGPMGLVQNSSLFSFESIYNITPRLHQLLDYYDRAICPILVAFDGDGNPYRKHIVSLAYQNPGLQNALAALATNNMRMRTAKGMRQLKYEKESSFESIAASVGQPSNEEQHYKGKSIELLNAQLADTGRATDDSVLATLLILCLFHVCDSGFSKFKTQLAGVQKLLKLRGDGRQSEFVGWVEMFFAWFDVMTSAVNDRELQIQGDSLDLMNPSNNLGALEQFSGCDGRLFKLIARLGRLNLLSQSRPVRGFNGGQSREFGEAKAHVGDFYSMDFEDVDEKSSQSDGTRQGSAAADNRTAFWQEWHDIRQRLFALDLDRYDPAANSAPQRDLVHISESFRYSALLYTERLAHPTSPGSSANLQGFVSQALHHIRQIGENSCVTKFMLWPLFITGTECVLEDDRDLIRDRCIEIQEESGFYNNVSGLELLERVWREAGDDDDSSIRGCAAQAFAWRKAMDRVDGEYIVV